MKCKSNQSIEPEGPDAWKTCCAKLPEGLPAKLAEQAILTKRCEKMMTCLTREDIDDFTMEFLCPRCGFLVRRVTRSETNRTYARQCPYNHHWGECPAGKRVIVVLIHCIACRYREGV